MRIIDLILCLSFAFVMMVSCDKVKDKKQIYPNVEFVYMEKSMEFMNALNSPEKVLSLNFCVDTIITDSDFVRKFIFLTDSLVDDPFAHSIDIRVVSKIHFTDSTERVVCFGGYFNTMVDNVMKKDNPELWDLINNVLYDECGWRKVFTQSFSQNGDSDIINTPEIQKEINECVERARKAGDVYPK